MLEVLLAAVAAASAASADASAAAAAAAVYPSQFTGWAHTWTLLWVTTQRCVFAHVCVCVSDTAKIWRRLKADVVLVSPPWGGPQYAEDEVMAMSTLPCPIASIIAITRHITPNAM